MKIKTLSDSLETTYKKFELKESEVGENSIQKVLRLFGYPNATSQQYVCCLSESPRMDIHTYEIASRAFLMCLVTNSEHQVLNAILWNIPMSLKNKISKHELSMCKNIQDLDKCVSELSPLSKLIMRY